MSLTPWIERDPFHKEADFPALNLIQPENDNEIFMAAETETAKPITGHLDFETEAPVLVTARPKLSTISHKMTTIIDNKLDISTSTTKRHKKKRTTSTTTTRRPTAIIDNKLDFSPKKSTKLTSKVTTKPTTKLTTKLSDSPFSKMKRDTTNLQNRWTTATKHKRSVRSVDDMTSTTTDTNLTDDPTDIELDTSTKRQFLNQDNATKYFNNRAISPRFDDDIETTEVESKADDPEGRYEAFRPDNDFDYGDPPYRLNYNYSPRPSPVYPLYPPLSQSITKRPVGFQNNRPNYQNTNFVNLQDSSRPTNSPISHSKYSTPFSYDTYHTPGSISSMSPQINYENMAIPLYISPNRPSYQSNFNRPTYATTKKIDLTTFFIVETTRRTTTSNFIDVKRTTQRPYVLNTFLDSGYQNSFPSDLNYQSSNSDDSTNFSILSSSNTNEFSNKKPLNHFRPPSVFSYDTNNGKGHLRPDPSFYTPIKADSSYHDYSNYNNKPETANNVKYVYMQNVLHKYYEGKSNEKDEDDGGLYDRQQTKRYAEFYDDNKSSSGFETLARTLTDKTKKSRNSDDANQIFFTKTKNRPQDILLVPFKLLTKIDRPDNWIIRTTDQDLKSQLLEVPALEQDGNVAGEVPKPIFGRIKS